MDFETNIISLINGIMPDSPLRKSRCSEVDSEVFQLGERDYLFTIDDFSKEDLFRESDPFVLGWNIACAAISDIIAAGGKPVVYSHAMVISRKWNEKYIERFSRGISDVLKKYSLSFIGGDLGISDDWRYTASVIGEPTGKLINRKGNNAEDSIFITGKIGAGNLEAAMNLYSENRKMGKILKMVKNQFSIHEKIPEIISKYASSAIDTSDGVFAALQTLSKINRNGFKIDKLSYVSKGILASEILNLPKLLLFLGECGEYEILFTVSNQDKKLLMDEMKVLKLKIYEIGKITEKFEDKTISLNGKRLDVADFNFKARNFGSVKEYLKNIIDWVNTKSESLGMR